MGGDVLALAADPHDPARLYLGTADGHIFRSNDGGAHWQLAGHVSDSYTAVITTILVDPRNSQMLYASVWTHDSPREGGGVFISRDAGTHWETLKLEGHAVRALAQAPSQANIFVAGALDGVFLSNDNGAHWERISAAHDPELRNIDSIAIDPLNPRIIYAGTFHLPWKTTDAGRHWFPIHNGMIDDSDVFSLFVDRSYPNRVYASACSGIYRSKNGGNLWIKIQGIPFSARRTHVVAQDPSHPNIVYAGTTQGLWKTSDGGAHWKLMTPANWVINALLIQSAGVRQSIAAKYASYTDRVVMGTEQMGVLVSDNGGTSLHASNDGFSHRQILSFAVDPVRPTHIAAVLANAPMNVIETQDAGKSWHALDGNSHGDGVRGIYATLNGWIAALENGGIELYDSGMREWRRVGTVLVNGTPALFQSKVNAMSVEYHEWLAATSVGLFVSRDSGAAWRLLPFGPEPLPVESVTASPDGKEIWIVSSGGMLQSQDDGRTWKWRDLPLESGGALAVKFAEGYLLVAAQKGLYISDNDGKNWSLAVHGLPATPADSIAVNSRSWAVSMHGGGIYISEDYGRSWDRVDGPIADGPFPILVVNVDGGVYAGSASDGLYALAFRSLHSATRSAASFH